jgi:DNA adenine methylase
MHSTRGDDKAYGYEMDEIGHRQLAEVLLGCGGYVALSGYRCDIIDELYQDWRRYDAQPKTCHSVKQVRQDALWMNYQTDEAGNAHRL